MDACGRGQRHGEINGTDVFDAVPFRGETPWPELIDRDRGKVSPWKQCLDCPICSLGDGRNRR